MRKPMFSCAESGTFRFAARRARFSGFMSCRFSVGSFLHRMGVYVFRAAVYPVSKASIGSGEMGL